VNAIQPRLEAVGRQAETDPQVVIQAEVIPRHDEHALFVVQSFPQLSRVDAEMITGEGDGRRPERNQAKGPHGSPPSVEDRKALAGEIASPLDEKGPLPYDRGGGPTTSIDTTSSHARIE
jgi:hypothetical protein